MTLNCCRDREAGQPGPASGAVRNPLDQMPSRLRRRGRWNSCPELSSSTAASVSPTNTGRSPTTSLCSSYNVTGNVSGSPRPRRLHRPSSRHRHRADHPRQISTPRPSVHTDRPSLAYQRLQHNHRTRHRSRLEHADHRHSRVTNSDQNWRPKSANIHTGQTSDGVTDPVVDQPCPQNDPQTDVDGTLNLGISSVASQLALANHATTGRINASDALPRTSHTWIARHS